MDGSERAAGKRATPLPSSAPGEDFLRLAAGLAPCVQGINERREVACRARAAMSPAAERRVRWRQFISTRCGQNTRRLMLLETVSLKVLLQGFMHSMGSACVWPSSIRLAACRAFNTLVFA